MAEKVTRTNQSADKIFDVVETMVRNGAPMRLNDIAKLSGIPQSTAFRMINALRERGYVIQDENSAKYTLSLKFSLIGDMVRAKFDLRDLVHPYMLNIAASCDGICYLAIPPQQELVYIDMVSPPGSVLTRMPFIGKHVPLHCGGNGIIILSGYSDAQLEEYLRQASYDKPSPKTVTDPESIRAKVKEVQQLGYSFCTEQLESGNGSIAVGLRNHLGQIIAGLSVGGPIERLTDEYVRHALPHLRHAAEEISAQLAYKAL